MREGGSEKREGDKLGYYPVNRNQPIVRVFKVLGDLLGHFSPPSPESGQNSGPESVPKVAPLPLLM